MQKGLLVGRKAPAAERPFSGKIALKANGPKQITNRVDSAALVIDRVAWRGHALRYTPSLFKDRNDLCRFHCLHGGTALHGLHDATTTACRCRSLCLRNGFRLRAVIDQRPHTGEDFVALNVVHTECSSCIPQQAAH